MTQAQLQNAIVKIYDEDDSDFPKKALKTRRMGRIESLSRFLSFEIKTLKRRRKDEEKTQSQKDFNKMEIKEQLKFQALSRLENNNKWVHSIEILPSNIESLYMAWGDASKARDNRDKLDTAALEAPLKEFDPNELLKRLTSAFFSPTTKRHELAAAVILVTGRRTAEVLKTARFYLSGTQSSVGYTCMFSGQIKEGLKPRGDYEIPLLAPFWLIEKAMTKIRQMYPAESLTLTEVNESFASTLGAYTKDACGMTPHQLRTCYAIMTYTGKMSVIGHIKNILGQANSKASTHYQRMKMTEEFTGPLVVEEEVDLSSWNLDGAVETKRLPGILDMMKQRIPLTATAIIRHTGGSTSVIGRIIEKNKSRIDKYNQSL